MMTRGTPILGNHHAPKSSILDWDFPRNKPSSYWGTPITMETIIIPNIVENSMY